MAVHPDIPGINISILVDNKPATEHIPSPEDFPPLIDATGHTRVEHNRCHIKSQAGKPFAIRFRISPIFKFPRGKTTLIISIYVDGKPFDNRVILKRIILNKTRLNREYVDTISYCHREFPDGSSECYKPFFQDIRHPGMSVTTFVYHKMTNLDLGYQADDGSGISDPERIEALGSIQVAIEVARETAGSAIMADDEFSDNKRNETLVVDNAALHRYGSGQIHATTYVSS